MVRASKISFVYNCKNDTNAVAAYLHDFLRKRRVDYSIVSTILASAINWLLYRIAWQRIALSTSFIVNNDGEVLDSQHEL